MKNIYNVILGLLFILNINHIHSQEATNDTIVPLSLEEVIVSIPFSKSIVNNVIKVNKVNLGKLGFMKSQSIPKALFNTPGISFITTGPGIQKPSIRGLNGNRVVTVYQGTRFENMQWGDEHGLEIHTSGISSIELIKGPLSVLYGSDAIGGVLYITPEDYLLENDFKVDIESLYNTNYSGINSSVGINTTINKFSLLARASIIDAGDYESPDGVVENTKFDMTDFKFGIGFNSKSFSSDLRMNFNSSNLGIPHSDEHDDHEDDHGDDDHDDDHDDEDDHDDDHEDEHGDEEESYQELENTVISWKNSIKFNKSELVVTLGISDNLRKEFGHHDEEGHDDHDDDHDDGDDDDHDDDHDDHDEDHEGEAHIDMQLQTTSLDFKYIFPKSGKFDLILGGSIMNQENSNFGEEELIPNAEKKDFGIYAISNFKLNGLDLLIGLRSDQRDIELSSFNKSYSSFTSSFGLKTNMGKSSVLRLNYSSGYRAPNLSELFADGVHHGVARYDKGDPNLGVEKSNQINASFNIYSEKTTFGLDVFNNTLNNYIYIRPAGTSIGEMPLYNYVQDDSNLFGFELTLSKKTNVNWFSYDTSLAYLQGKIKDGGDLPMISPLAFKLNFNFDFEKAGAYEIGLLSKGSQNSVADFETPTDSYSLVDVSGSYVLKAGNNDLDLFWEVENLFDTEYVDHLSRLKNLNLHDMGRNISVGLKYSF